MTDETCILTTKDQLILEAMVRRRDVASGDHLQLLQRKLEAARIVLSSDVPPTVATMSSRVLYRIDGSEAAARIISFDHAYMPAGLILPVTELRGLALLGLGEGQSIDIPAPGGGSEIVSLVRVLYQPEAMRGGATTLPLTPRGPRNGPGTLPRADNDDGGPGPGAA